jgi:hypothetical protein
MAEYDIYIDCDRAAVVTSASNSSLKALPKFVQGDTMLLRVHLLKGYAAVMESYEVIPTTGLTLQVALGTRVGNSTTYYTQNLTDWDEAEDLTYFEGEFPMSTEAITTYLGSNGSKQAYFEVKYIREGLPTTVLSEQVTILAAVIKDGGFEEPVDPTPASVEAIMPVFHPKTGSAYYDLIDSDTGGVLRLTYSGGVLVQTVLS